MQFEVGYESMFLSQNAASLSCIDAANCINFITLILILSQTRNFRLFQTEKFADDSFKFDEHGRQFFKWEENTVEKGDIARYERFLLFPQCFQNLYCRHVKSQGLFRKVLIVHQMTANTLLDKF